MVKVHMILSSSRFSSRVPSIYYNIIKKTNLLPLARTFLFFIWLNLTLADLTVIHKGHLWLSLTASHQLRTYRLLPAVLVACWPIEQRLHAVKVLWLLHIWPSLGAEDAWVLLLILAATATSTDVRHILGIGLLRVGIWKVVEIVYVARSTLERVLVHTYSTTMVAKTSCILLRSISIVIVKIFIFILNYYFLEYLMTSNCLAWRNLALTWLIRSFLLCRFVLTRVELSIHHGMVHDRIP